MKVSYKAQFCSLEHGFLLQKALKSEFKTKTVHVTLCLTPPAPRVWMVHYNIAMHFERANLAYYSQGVFLENASHIGKCMSNSMLWQAFC